MKLGVLMTVYNEAEFVEQAIKACLPYIDHLVVVEGAYQETIKLGASPRSTDGTIQQIQSAMRNVYPDDPVVSKLICIEANEQTDKDQRNVGLKILKELGCDWLLIIDGDEVYEPSTFQIIRNYMRAENLYAAYFTSLTFVNDLQHYTRQEFPRLFRITPECQFTNDNYMAWPDTKARWEHPNVMFFRGVKYHHYAFCKGTERFELKKKWWETRFGRPFDYGWELNEKGEIHDPKNHQIYVYDGKHPSIMENHRLFKGDIK